VWSTLSQPNDRAFQRPTWLTVKHPGGHSHEGFADGLIKQRNRVDFGILS
jgi:hypothetical protein